MTKFLTGLILMSLAVACGKGFEKQKSKKETNRQEQDSEDSISIQALQYLDLVNAHRVKMKLAPLTYNPIIEDVARSHSKAMALGSRPFGHMGFSSRCRQIKNRLGPYVLCGEIVAMGQKNPKEVFRAWLNSPRHRREIENPDFTHTGLGIVKDNKGTIYWTQMMVELD